MMSTTFVGCACDRKFVNLTCTMLSSVEENGDVSDAIVMVADFGLVEADRNRIRLAAGTLGRSLRFVEVDRGSALIPALPTFDFPLPLIGRFVIPKTIEAPRARLLLIDSDMIVNSSLRPLFDMDMQGHPLGAIPDPLSEPELRARGREPDPSYFNAGLTLIDLDVWNARKLSDAAMLRLAAYPDRPIWLDQDAINDVLDDDWVRLDRGWNLFFAGDDRQFTFDEYRAAPIVHFAGAKPDEAWTHPAIPLYRRQVERVSERLSWRGLDGIAVDRDFIASCYEVFLGRDLDSEVVVADRGHWLASAVIGSVLNSAECREAVITPVLEGRPLANHLYRDRLRPRHRYWIMDRVPLLPSTIEGVAGADSWHGLLSLLLADARLQGLMRGEEIVF